MVEMEDGIDYLYANLAQGLLSNMVTHLVINLWKQGLTSVNRQEPVGRLGMRHILAMASNQK